MATKLKGQNLRVFLDGKVITAALSCQLKIKAQVRDTSTKDTVDSFAHNEIVGFSWEVSAQSAVWTGDGPGKSTKDLLDYRGAVVDLELAPTEGAYNAEKSDILLHGKAIVTAITVTAKNRENSTCDIILTGKGDLHIPKLLADVLNIPFITSDGMGLVVDK